MLNNEFMFYLGVISIIIISILCYVWIKFDPYKKMMITENKEVISQARNKAETLLSEAKDLASGLSQLLKKSEKALIEVEKTNINMTEMDFCRSIEKSIGYLNCFVANISCIIEKAELFKGAIKQARELGDDKYKDNFGIIISEMIKSDLNYSDLYSRLNNLVCLAPQNNKSNSDLTSKLKEDKLLLVIESALADKSKAKLARFFGDKCYK